MVARTDYGRQLNDDRRLAPLYLAQKAYHNICIELAYLGPYPAMFWDGQARRRRHHMPHAVS